MIGGAQVWFGGKVFGGPENAKKVYKYHRYVLLRFDSRKSLIVMTDIRLDCLDTSSSPSHWSLPG